MERDSHSSEARELVHKIFRLLEQYEAHHQLLAKKIQQTEWAADQTARIQPMWSDAEAIDANAIHQSNPKLPSTTPAASAKPVSASYPSNLQDFGASTAFGGAPPATAATTATIEPPKPQLTSVATNTYWQNKPIKSDARPQVLPIFNEALLSAK